MQGLITVLPKLTNTTNTTYLELEKVLQAIKSDKYKAIIEAIRQEEDKETRNKLKATLPCVLFSGKFKERKASALEKHSGLICLDFDNFPDIETLEKEKAKLVKDNYTRALFVSPSGNGLKVIVAIPDDITTPQAHISYFKALQDYYKSEYLDIGAKDVSRVCYVSYDPNLYYNIGSLLWYKKQNQTYLDPKPTTSNVTLAMDEEKTIEKLRKWFDKKFAFTEGQRNNSSFVLACAFCEFGIQKENTLKYILTESGLNEKEVTTLVNSAYRTASFNIKAFEDKQKLNNIRQELKTKPVREVLDNNPELDQSKIENIKNQPPVLDVKNQPLTVEWTVEVLEYLQWQFKIDKVKDTFYYSKNGKPFVSTDQDDNIPDPDTLVRKVWAEVDSYYKSQGGKREFPQKTLDAAIDRVTQSFHPIKDKINSLKWDGTKRIPDFLSHFQDEDGVIGDYLMSFMLGSVEKLYNPNFQNPILIFSGKQGLGKSQFIRWLASAFLPDYFIDTEIDPQNKDSKLALTQHFITEWGELARYNKRDLDALKALITIGYITERKPYGKRAVRMPMLANVIATYNPVDDSSGILKDVTGNRRFRPVTLTNINWEYTNFDIDQIWAEIVEYWKNDKEKSWQKMINETEKAKLDQKFMKQPEWLESFETVFTETTDPNEYIFAEDAYKIFRDKYPGFSEVKQGRQVTEFFIVNYNSRKKRIDIEGTKRTVFPNVKHNYQFNCTPY